MPLIEIRQYNGTLLIGYPSDFPPILKSAHDSQSAHRAFQALWRDPKALAELRRQWPRLFPGTLVHARNDNQLQIELSEAIDRKRVRLVGLYEGGLRSEVAKPPPPASAPTPVNRMSVLEKVEAALKLSLRYLPGELQNAAVFTAIMEIGIFLVGLISVQLAPGVGEVVDVAVAAIAYAIGGLATLYALGQLVHAVYTAARAQSDQDLDRAAQELASAFVAFGVGKLMKFRAKLLGSRVGGTTSAVEENGRWTASNKANPIDSADSVEPRISGQPNTISAEPEVQTTNWRNADGSINWPPENGAIPGTITQTTIPVGKVLDRYGGTSPNSDFLSPAGTPIEQRALSPSTDLGTLDTYRVIKELPVQQSQVAPWFDQPGRGTQYQTTTGATGMTIPELVDAGYLERITQ